ncbi:uncharacterized protein LOC116804160 [Drosophila mojavensis]|uniref:uncharacterized protein LOC116804160 n=1 Tax=Drosophila mojavensis TaxID=7230 RepID=UPI0013EEAF7D|nr:uncharacterized protein LOC116804160 [Drosophila mojavensis]
MNSSMMIFYVMVVSLLLLLITPVAESTIVFFACLYNLNICPFRATTLRMETTST